ncbi:poly(A) RNA polymerase gld-2 homolog A [Trichonephila clavata]|uniref:Poly(A) RNA polymerase gld-2 homolog A n=1 Tax=Trichonephila clavata TaxID=2740835 RepID=A0A8X6LAJ3_TRICU|nr:poly(A) RNA polymerase gld-2 homolog A [Trichonephila clavata]
MDHSNPVYKKPIERRHADNAPVFYTGLTNIDFDFECLTSLLCRQCKKNLKNFEPNSNDLCNNCIAESKKCEETKQSDEPATTLNYKEFSPNAKRTLLPAPTSPYSPNLLLKNSNESHSSVNGISDQGMTNPISPSNQEMGRKWKSSLRERLNLRNRTSPYSQGRRINQNYNENLHESSLYSPAAVPSPNSSTPVYNSTEQGMTNSISPSNQEMGRKWKSSLRERLNLRNRTSPYSQGRRINQNYNENLHESSLYSPAAVPSPNSSTPVYNSTEQLSMEMWKLFHQNRQTEDVFNKKMTLRDKLHNILRERFPNCGLYVVGSSMTGLGVKSSDIDMCLMLTDSEVDQQKEAIKILHSVKYLFHKYKFLYDMQVIYAKVPILKFAEIESGIEVDLNINNTIGIRNTQLLSSYARTDKRLPPLVVLAKIWARHHGINDAKNNSLSSYSIVLMVIHYLQYRCQPPVLPCLQKLQSDKFLPSTDIRKLKLHEDLPDFISENHEDLGDLFIGFLKYYSEEFNYQKNAISIRLGCVIPREDAAYNSSPKNKVAHWKFLCIEEPFDLTNTARAVFNPEVFEHIQHAFRTSCNRIIKVSKLNSILS